MGDFKREQLRKRRQAWAMAGRAGRCASCNTSTACVGHHILTQQTIRREARTLGLDQDVLLWDLRNCMALCALCHDRHHSRALPIAWEKLPAEAVDFAEELGLRWVLERLYPVTPAAA